jgi:hypothetical protein
MKLIKEPLIIHLTNKKNKIKEKIKIKIKGGLVVKVSSTLHCLKV